MFEMDIEREAKRMRKEAKKWAAINRNIDCGESAPWTDVKQRYMDALESGEDLPISEYPDPSLAEVVDEWLWAARRSDVCTLSMFEMEMSDEHMLLEERGLERFVEWTSLVSHHRIEAVRVDPGNNGHVRVITSVVYPLRGVCREDIQVSEWLRLDGRWYTMPEMRRKFSAARKNRGVSASLGCALDHELGRADRQRISAIDARTVDYYRQPESLMNDYSKSGVAIDDPSAEQMP